MLAQKAYMSKNNFSTDYNIMHGAPVCMYEHVCLCVCVCGVYVCVCAQVSEILPHLYHISWWAGLYLVMMLITAHKDLGVLISDDLN